MQTTAPDTEPESSTSLPQLPVATPIQLERRGRRWLIGSFAFCPCHLPLTLAMLSVVLGGTGLGATVAEHALVAGAIITSVWVAGTAYGFRLIRRSQSGTACET